MLYFTVIGPIVLSFFLAYATYFVVDRDLGAIDAIKASAQLAMRNVGQTIIMVLLGGLIAAAGSLLCGVGMLVTAPCPCSPWGISTGV